VQNVPFCKGYALKTGVHVGHKSLRLSKTNFWHPLMAQYILGIRHGISLLDTVQTRKCLLRAFYVIALVLKTKNRISRHPSHTFDPVKSSSFFHEKRNVSFSSLSRQRNQSKKDGSIYAVNGKETQKKQIQRKGHILIVNTNPEFSRLCKNLSVLTLHNKNDHLVVQKGFLFEKNENLDFGILNKNTSSLSYVHYKWVGGTLTNWKQVSKSVLTYAKFAERCEKFIYRNNIDFPRYKKIKECFHGLIRKKQGKVFLAFNEKPDLVFLMNPNENRHIITEANKMHIPVIALVESNTCLNGISYPIPANAYSAFFIYYCLKKIIKLSTI
jgi:ribosomal protein S2